MSDELQKSSYKELNVSAYTRRSGLNWRYRLDQKAGGSIYNYFPPWHTAAAAGQLEAALFLLDNGAQINRVSDFENTALNMAASDGHKEVVRLLLERGADACYKSSAGTAGDIAQARGHQDIAELLRAAEATKCHWAKRNIS